MDIVYNTDKLSIDIKKEICEWSKHRSFDWWVDILDCSKSSRRHKIKCSWEKIIEKLNDSCHFTVINRRDGIYKYVEVVFCTLAMRPDYFLWVLIDEDYLNDLISTFNLTEKL